MARPGSLTAERVRTYRLIRDPVHGYVELPNVLELLVADPRIQRLRRISQNALASNVYPAMTGTRFEHSLGTMHLASRAWRSASLNSPDAHAEFVKLVRGDLSQSGLDEDQLSDRVLAESLRLAAAALGLLHDVGHAPFSHTLEPFFASQIRLPGLRPGDSVQGFHELAGRRIARSLVEGYLSDTRPLFDLLKMLLLDDAGSSAWGRALHGLVSGEIDVDRMDYLVRDATKAGTEFGHIDVERLLRTLEIWRNDTGGFQTVIGSRGRSAAETLLLQRTQAYRWIFFHPHVVGTNLALLRACETVSELGVSQSPITALRLPPRRVGEVFSKAAPRLDYVSEAAPLALEDVFPDLPTTTRAQIPPPKHAASEITRLARSSSTDDCTVIEWLKQSAEVADLLVRHDLLQDGDLDLARRFNAYHDAAVLRRPNFISAWKVYDEYADVATRMAKPLAKCVDDAMKEVEHRNPHVSRRILRDQRLEIKKAQRHPVTLLNHVVDVAAQLKEPPTFAKHMTRELSAGLEGVPGFCDVFPIVFQAIKSNAQMTVILHGDSTVPLRNTSAIVESLDAVNDLRIGFFVYFFAFETTSRTPTELPAREALREVVVNQLPEWALIPYFLKLDERVQQTSAVL